MSRRTQIIVFVVLLAVLAGVLYGKWNRGPQLGAVLFANEKFEPLGVTDPALRLDLLERVRKLEYDGPKRNIFSASLPPKPAPTPPLDTASQQPLPPTPPVPPSLQLPVKFYGYATDPSTGKRRAFFTDGDTVWILREGDVLQGKFLLLRIGNQTAEMEEVSTGRRATLQLEEIPSP